MTIASPKKKRLASKISELISRVFGVSGDGSAVIIPSKMGLPSAKVCGVVLADTGCTDIPCNDTTGGPCSGDVGPCPTLAFRNPNQKLEPASVENPPQSVVVKSISQSFKKSILDLKGIIDINFGKALAEGDEFEATKVDFDAGEIDLGSILKIYTVNCSDCAVFCPKGDKEGLIAAIEAAGLSIVVHTLSRFDS